MEAGKGNCGSLWCSSHDMKPHRCIGAFSVPAFGKIPEKKKESGSYDRVTVLPGHARRVYSDKFWVQTTKMLLPDHYGGKNDRKSWTPTVFQLGLRLRLRTCRRRVRAKRILIEATSQNGEEQDWGCVAPPSVHDSYYPCESGTPRSEACRIEVRSGVFQSSETQRWRVWERSRSLDRRGRIHRNSLHSGVARGWIWRKFWDFYTLCVSSAGAFAPHRWDDDLKSRS